MILSVQRITTHLVGFTSKITRRYLFAVKTSKTTMTSTTIPEGVRLNWDITEPSQIDQRAQKLKDYAKSVYDKVGAVSHENIGLDDVMTLINSESETSVEYNMLDFPQHVFLDKQMRTASTNADKMLSECFVELSMREDVFQNMVAAKEKDLQMKPEVKRYLERVIKEGRRNGLHLSKEIQDEIKSIKKRCSNLSIEFSKNCNEENTILEFTKEELAGLPDDFMNRLKKSDCGNKLKVSLKYPEYFPCMKNVRIPSTRQALEKAFNSRCIQENTAILEELVQLRDKKAKLLGFSTHADFITEMRMSKNAKTVEKFLSELATKLAPLGRKEVDEMLLLKRKECEEHGYTYDGKIHYYDMSYYMNMIEKQKYSVDHDQIKKYFPMEVVTNGLLGIYQELLSLTFTLVERAQTWHDDVTMYSVRDNQTNSLVGYFYLDLFPREGKYGHAACFGLQPGCLLEDGQRQLPVAAMVCNFTKPTPESPSLFTHDEVETFFHEFGHVMHQLCAEAEVSKFSGTSVERDFVEAPSQMLENWCWEEDALKRMSKHYQDGSELPADLLEALVKSRNANAGLFNLRQITLGTFDQRIHTRSEANTAELFAKTSEEILTICQTPGTNMSASFGHLAGGYDAQYYGYMWSEVFSMDMFHSRFKKEGIFNKDVGMAYRRCILKPGGSIDATEMLKNFLAREPNDKAFLQSKGLE